MLRSLGTPVRSGAAVWLGKNEVVPYAGPLCYDRWAPCDGDVPADRAAAAIHPALAEVQIDLERDR